MVPAQADPRQSNVSVILLPANRRKKMGSVMAGHQRLHYRYLDFSLSDFSPTKGAASGGSLVRISGHNLHIGSRVEAFFDEVPCTVDRRHRSANTILCSTGSVGQERVAQHLTLVLDGARRTLASPFFYTADPIVRGIKPLTSFAAGGRVLTVHGEFLNSVTNAELLVVFDGKTPPIKLATVSQRKKSREAYQNLRQDNTTARVNVTEGTKIDDTNGNGDNTSNETTRNALNVEAEIEQRVKAIFIWAIPMILAAAMILATQVILATPTILTIPTILAMLMIR